MHFEKKVNFSSPIVFLTLELKPCNTQRREALGEQNCDIALRLGNPILIQITFPASN